MSGHGTPTPKVVPQSVFTSMLPKHMGSVEVVVVVVDDVVVEEVVVDVVEEVVVVVDMVGAAVVGEGDPRQPKQMNGHCTITARSMHTVGSNATNSVQKAASWTVAQSIPATMADVGATVEGAGEGDSVVGCRVGLTVGAALGDPVGCADVGWSVHTKHRRGQKVRTPGISQFESGKLAQFGKSAGPSLGKLAQMGEAVGARDVDGAAVGAGSVGSCEGARVVAHGRLQRFGQVD